MFSTTVGYLTDKIRSSGLDTGNEIDISGKIVLITGANSGIGKTAAEQFAQRNAVVIMACRDMVKGQSVLEEIKKKYPNSQLVLLHLDLGDLDQIRKFCREFKEKYDHIDILVNNAGIYFTSSKLEKTKEGFERHFGINHLGPFLLTFLLLDLVKKASPSRIVFVASTMHQIARISIDDLMMDNAKSLGINNLVPYANSKYANMLTCRELSKKLEGTGVTCYSLCPGMVGTGLFSNEPWYKKYPQSFANFFAGLSPERGCETTIYCALNKSIGQESGNMYRFNKKWDKACKNLDDNEQLAKDLWEKSEILVGIKN